MLKQFVLILFIIVSTGSYSYADEIWMTGNKLKYWIDSYDEYARGNAIGYILGVVDALNGKSFSVKMDVTKGQMRDVVYIYLDKNPHLRHIQASTLVIEAMKEAYPLLKDK